MGKIIKRFTVSSTNGRSSGMAKIDSGADRTILGLHHVRKLGYDICAAPNAVMRSVGDGRLLGATVPVRLRIGRKEGVVQAFVPLFRRGKRGTVENVRKTRTLIGHDFLQSAKAVIDYRKHPAQLSDRGWWPFEWKLERATAAETRMMRKAMRCERRPKKRRGK